MAVPRPRRWQWVVLGYVVILAIVEMSLNWSVPVGILCHAVLLLALLNHYAVGVRKLSTKESDEGAQVDHSWSSLPMLALIPVLRIASVTTPDSHASPIFWYALVTLPLALGVIMTCRLVGVRPTDVGLRWTPAQPGIALSGVPLAFIAFELGPASPVVTSADWRYLVVGSLVLLLLGSLEEVVYRGLIQRSMCQLFGLGGIILPAVLSAAAATGSGSRWFVASSGAVAIVFGLLVHRTGSIIGVALAHGVVNVFALVLLANPAPGFGR